jgi:hypothetical protein
MLLSLLKALGLNIPARIASVQEFVERRVGRATDEVKAAIQQAVVTAMLAAVAGITAAAALSIGLVMLGRWVAENYGAYAGYGAVAALLALVSIVLGTLAWARSRPARQSPGEAAAAKLHATDTEGTEGPPPPSAQARHAAQPEGAQLNVPSSAAALIEFLPLVTWLLARWPATGSSTIGALAAGLRRTARTKVVQGAMEQIAEGDRLNLLAAVAGAVLVGWLMVRRARRDQHVD